VVRSSGVGYSRRREAREIAEAIDESNRRIAGVTLGQVCAANLAVLEVSCHVCPRRGRYRVTRLIDRHGAGKSLTDLKDILSADCPSTPTNRFSAAVAFTSPAGVRRAESHLQLEPLIAGVPNLRARIFDQECLAD